eukprot:scaffold65703_cov48-Phaeocystis_antarctica.AAC.2
MAAARSWTNRRAPNRAIVDSWTGRRAPAQGRRVRGASRCVGATRALRAPRHAWRPSAPRARTCGSWARPRRRRRRGAPRPYLG